MYYPPMEQDEYRLRLLAEFDRLVDDRGRGTLAEMQKSLEVSPGYFRQWKHGTPIKHEKLLQALEFLGVEPFVFFARALLPPDMSEFELDVLLLGRQGRKSIEPRTAEGKRAVELVRRKGLL